jgi:hypothetical protein
MKILSFCSLLLLLYLSGHAQNTFPSSGNAGIGTINPESSLQVNSGESPSHSQLRITANGTGGVSALSYAPDNSSLNFDSDWYAGGWISRSTSAASIYKQTGKLVFYGSAGLTAGAYMSLVPRMTIDLANGHVGIGTTSPQTKLDINGVIQTYNKDTPTASWDNLQIWSDGASSHIQSHGDEDGLYIKSTSGNKIALLSRVGVGTPNATTPLDVAGTIQTRNGEANWDNLQMWSDGVSSHIESQGDENGLILKSGTGNKILLMSDVAIGTTQTDAKLTVKGKIHAEEVKVDLSVPAPDYVFEKAYDLKPLAEVETFITANKHLPEIPSAKAMEKEGVNVGDMQMKLLRKIEELTLYLFEQKKEITALKQEVAALKK